MRGGTPRAGRPRYGAPHPNLHRQTRMAAQRHPSRPSRSPVPADERRPYRRDGVVQRNGADSGSMGRGARVGAAGLPRHPARPPPPRRVGRGWRVPRADTSDAPLPVRAMRRGSPAPQRALHGLMVLRLRRGWRKGESGLCDGGAAVRSADYGASAWAGYKGAASGGTPTVDATRGVRVAVANAPTEGEARACKGGTPRATRGHPLRGARAGDRAEPWPSPPAPPAPPFTCQPLRRSRPRHLNFPSSTYTAAAPSDSPHEPAS